MSEPTTERWRIQPLMDMRDSLARAISNARAEVDHLEQQYDDLTRKLMELGADV